MWNIGFKEVKLTAKERTWKKIPRGLRLPNFIDSHVDVNEVLAYLSVAIIGIGSIGYNIAQKIARLQIKCLYLVDLGHFKPESILTHPIFIQQADEQ